MFGQHREILSEKRLSNIKIMEMNEMLLLPTIFRHLAINKILDVYALG